MAAKTLYDKRSQDRQTAHHAASAHLYRQSLPTLALVRRAMARIVAAVTGVLSVSDWNAALPGEPFTCQGEAYRSNGLGAVIDWPHPQPQRVERPVSEMLAIGVNARLGAAA